MSSTPEEATLLFNDGINLFMEDARLGLKYIMLRLEDELTKEDRANLRDLIARACAGQDVNESADRVRKAQSASQLAVTIADIVQNARSKKAAALGAIFGAHGVHHMVVGSPDDDTRTKRYIEAAVSGAVAASSIALLDDGTINIGLDEFLVSDT
jgi:hypothetical protein